MPGSNSSCLSLYQRFEHVHHFDTHGVDCDHRRGGCLESGRGRLCSAWFCPEVSRSVRTMRFFQAVFGMIFTVIIALPNSRNRFW